MRDSADVTGLLHELAAGRPEALGRLIPVVYEELKGIAHGQLGRERDGHTLNTTALVHEAYLRLVNVRQVDYRDRVLVDYARTRKREKRGGGAVHVPLSKVGALAVDPPDELLDLDAALERLEAWNERQCRVVEYRCFADLTIEETAEVLDVSTATVKRDWAFARAWLNRELSGCSGAAGPAGTEV